MLEVKSRSEKLAAMRKGANRNTKLTVSRRAKRTITPPYSKHGNEITMKRYVQSVVGTKDVRVLKSVMLRVNNVMDYTGEMPDAQVIKGYAKMGIVN